MSGRALRMLCVVLFSASMFGAEHLYEQHVKGPSVSFPQKVLGNYVYDLAEVVNIEDTAAINAISNQLILDENIPLLVVTIKSLEDFNAEKLSPRAYVNQLFDDWGIAFEDRDYGMLMFLSIKDRSFKFAFGNSWNSEQKNVIDQMWMNEMHPQFNNGDVSGGVLLGIRNLDTMVRSLDLPAYENPCYRGEDGLARCEVAEHH